VAEFKVSHELEAESLRDLKAIVEHSKTQAVTLVVIGGYAARAYTQAQHYRGTKDIDFIALRSDVGRLRGMLASLGYVVEVTRHGLRATKKGIFGEIKLDIAVDKVVDDSTGKTYYPKENAITNAKLTPIQTQYVENASLKVSALVAPIEDVVIMKLMTSAVARPRDKFDVAAMLLDFGDKLDKDTFVSDCENSGLENHTSSRLKDMLVQVKNGGFRIIWIDYSKLTLSHTQEKRLKKLLSELLAVLS